MNLTRRQLEVLQGLAAGDTYASLARRLGLSEDACRSHASCAVGRLGANSVPHAVALVVAEFREDDIVLTAGLRAYLRRFDRRVRVEPVPDLLLEDLAA